MQDYVGYRTQKRMQQKKKRGKAWRWLVVIAALFLIFVILGAAVKVAPFDKAWSKTAHGFVWVGHTIKSIWPWKTKKGIQPAQFLPEGKKTANYLLGVTKQVDGTTKLAGVVLASYDSRDKSGSLIYLPSDLLVEVPGAGSEVLSNLVQMDEGKISMTLVAVANLLGVDIDRYVLASDRDLSIALGKLAPSYEVNVTKKTTLNDKSLDVSLNLEPGKQKMNGRQLAAYLTYSASGQEIELIDRQQKFAPGFISGIGGGGSFNNISTLVKQNVNLVESDASNKELTGIWQAFALLKGDKLQQGTMPVKEFRMEKTVVHRVDTQKLPAFTKKYVKTETNSAGTSRVRVEILNGNGVPGIGEQVASRLSLNEFRVTNTANADNFNHADTVILVYGDAKKIASAALDIRKSLGLGRIESRPKTQDVSDITVVVGKDYTGK